MVTDHYMRVVKHVSKTWPSEYKVEIERNHIKFGKNHPLSGEIAAIRDGDQASIPYFSGERVAWITVAPSVSELIAAVADLRTWIFPSFAWEDPEKPLALPGEALNTLSALLFDISPAGYYRWWSLTSDVPKVAAKLGLMRHLASRRPEHTSQSKLSLFELRQQFEVALLTGDYAAAQSSIDEIDEYELDSASNTRFMQIRLWDQFREYESIVAYDELPEVVQIRVPQPIRVAILRAFYQRSLARTEQVNDIEGSLSTYINEVHPFVAGLLSSSSPNDGPEILRLIALKARFENDQFVAHELLENSDDEFVLRLLAEFESSVVPQEPLTVQFSDALQKGNWHVVQIVGRELLETSTDVLEGDIFEPSSLISALTVSLNFNANIELKDWLKDRATKRNTIDAGHSIPPVVPDAPPQTWSEYINYIKEGMWDAAEGFISLDHRPLASSLSLNDILRLTDDFEELLTNPTINANQTAYQLSIGAVPILMNDLLTDVDFPRPELVSVYRKLLEIWSEKKRGSASVPDANLLITLAEVALELDSTAETIVISALSEWWLARRIKALLPFLLSAADLISEYTNDKFSAENLWIDGAGFISADPLSLTKTERSIWRAIGKRIGLDDVTIDDFLSLPVADEEQLDDPLAQIDFKKVAVVSLREEAANNAAEMIRQRTGASVVVVTDTAAGAATDSAQSADVILFVWASSTHAVYRAFDSVRDKLEYVQGTGASSIIIALERWAITQKYGEFA